MLAYAMLHKPDFAALSVRLEAGQRIYAEPAAMMAMDHTITMKTSTKGGLWKSLKRGFGGESLFVNTFTAERGPGEVLFAPGPMGDLEHYQLKGNGLMIQRGGYVAHSDGVDLDGQWQGLKRGFFGEGMFLLRASGTGQVWFNTYGALVPMDVKDGEYIVDNSYVVAFEDTLDYRVSTITPKDAGILRKAKSFLFGGEMFVSRFSGRGRIWVQTRSVVPFTRWVHPYRPQKNNN